MLQARLEQQFTLLSSEASNKTEEILKFQVRSDRHSDILLESHCFTNLHHLLFI